MKFFSKFNKKNLQKTNTSISDYSCDFEDLSWPIRSYLNQDITIEDCLESIIETMAYLDYLRIKENKEIFPILEDLIAKSDWKSEWTEDCGDYDPDRSDLWLDCLYRCYDSKLRNFEASENTLKLMRKEITTENVLEMSKYHDSAITKEMYEKKDSLIKKRDHLKNIVESKVLSPAEALNLIKENWNFLYNWQSAYEAIEFCIIASTNHTTMRYFDVALRNIGYTLGPLFKKAKEKAKSRHLN